MMKDKRLNSSSHHNEDRSMKSESGGKRKFMNIMKVLGRFPKSKKRTTGSRSVTGDTPEIVSFHDGTEKYDDDVGGGRMGIANDYNLDVYPGKPYGTNNINTTTGTTLLSTVPESFSIDGAPIGRGNETALMAASMHSRGDAADREEERRAKMKIKVKNTAKRINWILRTRYFRKICDKVFDLVDADGSGLVDATELYHGLLMIHLKLGQYAGPAACRPLSRERCLVVFQQMDIDGSGTLDKEEFSKVMMVLFGNVIMRVIVQWHLTIIFVPMISKLVVFMVAYMNTLIMTTLQDMDEYHMLRKHYELMEEETIVGKLWERNVSVGIRISFGLVYKSIAYVLGYIPNSFWSSLPVTLLSTILGMVVVPYFIFRIDDFFTLLGDIRQSNKSPSSKKKARRGSSTGNRRGK